MAQGYQWATGFNNAAGLANVETDIVEYRNQPLIVSGRGTFDEGIIRSRSDKTAYATGFNSFTWFISVLGEDQYDDIQSSYTPGGTGYSAKMTVRTRNRSGDFANYNAVLRLPKKSELERIRGQAGFRNVELRFLIDSAL